MSDPEIVAVTAEIEPAAPGELELAQRGHGKLASAWHAGWPFARLALFGAAFVGGGILIGRMFGAREARRMGRAAGEGFAQGVAQVSSMTRGARWG